MNTKRVAVKRLNKRAEGHISENSHDSNIIVISSITFNTNERRLLK